MGARNTANIWNGRKADRIIINQKELEQEATKRCLVCREILPKTTQYYYRNQYKPDGLCEVCKPCDNAYRMVKHRIRQNKIKRLIEEHGI